MNNDHNNNNAEIQSSEQQLNTNTKVIGDEGSTNKNKQRTIVAVSKQIRRHHCQSQKQSHRKQYRSNNNKSGRTILTESFSCRVVIIHPHE